MNVHRKIFRSPRIWPAWLLTWLVFLWPVIFDMNPLGHCLNFPWLWLLLAVAATLAAQAGRLPWQSVLFAAALTTGTGMAMQEFAVWGDVPWGPLPYPVSARQAGLMMVFAVFNSRGLARLILCPARQTRHYGFWLMGLTTVLTVFFLTTVRMVFFLHSRLSWMESSDPWAYFGSVALNAAAQIPVTLLTLALVSPFFIRKQPGESAATDVLPAALWLGAVGLLAMA